MGLTGNAIGSAALDGITRRQFLQLAPVMVLGKRFATESGGRSAAIIPLAGDELGLSQGQPGRNLGGLAQGQGQPALGER
jgi:hypothetical protein